MLALLSDKPEELIIKDGCLRAGGYLLVWPYGFSLSTDKDGIFQVIDSTGQPVARVGDKVRIGGAGGEMSGGNSGDITKYSEELPSRCSWPYWIVGEVITVDKSTSPVATTPSLKSVPSQYFPGQAFDGAAGILTKKWDAENFAGFWRDSETGGSTETLVINQSILNNSYGVIEKHNLIYSTKSIPVKYQVYAHANKTPPGTEGFYQAIGWLGEKYTLLQENRLARIIFEQKAADVKIMRQRESWGFGGGYRLFANSIDVPLRGEEQTWITFFKDNTILEDKVLPNNSLFSYPENITSGGAPVFVTYTSNIYRLPQEDVADFKYTWLISQNVTEIKEGDTYGIMEVTSVKNNIIELRNKEPINLIPGSEIHLMGNMGIQVGGSEIYLLFYPAGGW
ncbi:MAG: S-layer protein domain-containing protein [Candidatus Methanoperedens sp.]